MRPRIKKSSTTIDERLWSKKVEIATIYMNNYNYSFKQALNRLNFEIELDKLNKITI